MWYIYDDRLRREDELAMQVKRICYIFGSDAPLPQGTALVYIYVELFVRASHFIILYNPTLGIF